MNMSEDINDDEIISYILGDLDGSKKKIIEVALSKDDSLKQKKETFAKTISLIEESVKQKAVDLPSHEWKLSKKQKNKIFPPTNKENVNLTNLDSAKNHDFNLLFWIPLGTAICASLIVMIGFPKKHDKENAVLVSYKDQENIKTFKISEIPDSLNLNASSNLIEQNINEGVNYELAFRTTEQILAINRNIDQQFDTNEELFISGQDYLKDQNPSITTETAKSKKLKKASSNSEAQDSLAKRKVAVSKEKIIPIQDFIEDKEIGIQNTPEIEEQDILSEGNKEFEKSNSNTSNVLNGRENHENQKTSHIKDNQIKNIKSAYLFTPSVKALCKIKIVEQNKNFFTFKPETKRKLISPALKENNEYQLRISLENKPDIIFVGKVDNQSLAAEENYIFKVNSSWILEDDEIRRPYDLNESF